MGQRSTAINLDAYDAPVVVAGEPMLDTSEGTLIITHADGTSRVFNWDYVIDYYYMTEEETASLGGLFS